MGNIFKVLMSLIAVPLVIIGVILLIPIFALVLLFRVPSLVIQDIWEVNENESLD